MVRTGRPRKFCRDEAISQAMMLFWEHGYESTSLAQLKRRWAASPQPAFMQLLNQKTHYSKKRWTGIWLHTDKYRQALQTIHFHRAQLLN